MTRQVLIIEDEPNIVEAISFILSRDGWAVATHADGKTAVDAVLNAVPDVLVLDVMLPGRSGYDILQELRGHDLTRRLPVLMLTARGQRTDREQAARLGVNCFMTKPFSNADVIRSLNELVPG
ncbi:response regulator [Aliiroseovarius sediminis]|uniref:response regulator transcription factor n=1 Tax=Aliiroseovarius sediminis TaxID=2925839 RepID=UPI001F575D56|nr:response regulator [Aliiroseovarius sediminis]MCI2394006.1 response regulator [Aliiroseovarius sediminis]